MNGANKEKVLEKEMTLEKTAIAQNEKKSQNEPTYKYRREDCEEGFLTDPDEIAEFMRHQQIDIYQNAMLGDYAVDGEYVLPDEIADELLHSYKVITNNYENFIFAQTIRPIGEYGVAKFFITVSQVEDGLLATLTVVEPVHKMNKLITNAQSAQIASYIDKGGESFYYGMKKEFNIVDDDFVVPSDADKFMYSLRRKQQRSAVWKRSLDDIEKTEKEIFEKRIKVLEKADNDYSKEVLSKFNTEFKKKEPFFKKAPNYNTCMNQLLDECMNTLAGRFPQQQIEVARKIKDAIKAPVEIQKKAIEIAKVETTRQKEKERPAPKVIEEKKERERPAPVPEKKKEEEKIGNLTTPKSLENIAKANEHQLSENNRTASEEETESKFSREFKNLSNQKNRTNENDGLEL